MVNTALAKRAFSKAARAKATAPEDLADRVEALLAARCQRLIGLARRAGDAVAGFEKVRAGLKAGRGRDGVLLVAADAAPDSARKIKALGGDTVVVDVLGAGELADAFATERTVHVLIGGGKLAAEIRRTAAKLAGFRGHDGRGTDNEDDGRERSA